MQIQVNLFKSMRKLNHLLLIIKPHSYIVTGTPRAHGSREREGDSNPDPSFSEQELHRCASTVEQNSRTKAERLG